ncbi:hypothetical protein MCT03_15825 [Vibrio aestuarianus]|nr:hypothetical protein [Vibrio aestuarianus]
MIYLEPYQIKKSVKENLDSLKIEAGLEGKILSKRFYSGRVCIMPALKISIPLVVAEYLKSCITVKQRYTSSKFSYISDVVIHAGGFKSALKQLSKIQDKYQDRDEDNIIRYIDAIEYAIFKANSTVSSNRRQANRESSKLSHCVLCWRRPNRSTKYCIHHHPSRSQSNYKETKNKLMNHIARTSSDSDTLEIIKINKDKNLKWVQIEGSKINRLIISGKLYTWLNKLSKKPVVGARLINQSHDCESTISAIIDICKYHYPLSYPLVNEAEFFDVGTILNPIIHEAINSLEHKNFCSWMLGVINAFDPEDANQWLLHGYNEFLSTTNRQGLAMSLMAVIARHEASVILSSVNNKPGPNKGFGKNNDQRKQLLHLLEVHTKANGKPDVPAIAERMKISTRRVYVLIKELQVNSEQ